LADVIPASTRADVRRNRRLLMEAGAAAFAEYGLDVQVSEITRRADLAKGTFFRHFPSKNDLLVAILIESVHKETVIAQSVMADPAGDVIERFMSESAAILIPLRTVMECSVTPGVQDRAFHEAMVGLDQVLDELLRLARTRGEVRDDITAIDLHALLLAATSTASHIPFRETPELWRRYLAITLDGLRPAAAHPLPVAPPDPPLEFRQRATPGRLQT
jgi:AcrR family transcriptional regulator